MKRKLIKPLAVGVIFVFALVSGLAWWGASSEAGLQWILAQLAARTNGALQFEGVEGYLGRIRIRRIVYKTPDLTVTLDAVAMDVSRSALARGELVAHAFEAEALTLTSAPSDKKPELPDSLTLPVDIHIERGSIKRADINGQVLRNLALAYQGGRAGHTVSGFKAESEYGSIALDSRVAGTSPFAVAANASVALPEQWAASAVVSGTLMRLEIRVKAEAKSAQVQAHARIAPFTARWLEYVAAHAQGVDLSRLDAGWPATSVEIDITGVGAAGGMPAGTLAARNLKPGTITAGRVPLHALRTEYSIDAENVVRLANLRADLGSGGSIAGSAQIGKRASRADLTIKSLDLRAFHPPLRATRLNGTVNARLDGAEQHARAKVAERETTLALQAVRKGDLVTLRQFVLKAGRGEIEGKGEITLAGAKRFAAHATLKRLDPSKFGDYPQALLNGDVKVAGTLAPQWRADVSVAIVNSLYRGVRLAGDASASVSPTAAQNVKVALSAGANVLRANGNFGRPRDVLEFALDAKRLAELDSRIAGAATANGRLAGEFKRAELNVDVVGSSLIWQKNLRIASLRASASGTDAQHVASISAKGDDFDFASRLEGSFDAQRGWSGVLSSFENSGKYPVTLIAPMLLAYARERFTAGPAQARFSGGRINLAALSWDHGRLNTRGELANVPVAPFLALSGVTAARTDLRVGGRWDLAATPRLNGTIALAREGGDVVMTGDTAVPLHLKRLQLDARVVNDAVSATVDVAAASVNGRLQAKTGGLTRDAALIVDGKVDLATLQLFDPLIGTHALLKGHAAVTLAATGTMGAPRFSGAVVAQNLGVEAPQFGVRLHDGTLRAELTDTALVLREFTIRGDEGRLTATGTASRTSGGGDTRLAWQADHLRVANRPDMRLKVDGSGTAALLQKTLVLSGSLRADDGYFEFNRPTAPRLADDIAIVGRPRPAARGGMRVLESQVLDVDVALDAGERVRIVGAGLDTYLRGKVALQTNKRGALEARGVLSSVRGVYYAFGQRLEIARARLIFDGPLDNPALDILAKRRNLAVEPGVEVTGSVRVPNVRLVSDPPVSDSEKLAWLTLGRGLKDANPADLGMLQTAAFALMNRGDQAPLTQRIANRIGLDEISLRGSGGTGTQVAAVGKHLSDKLYLEYEQGLAATSTVLRLSYALTRALSVRLEAGVSSAIGLFFTRVYD